MENKKAVNKISDKAALAQIDNFLDYYGIDKADMENEDGPEAVQTMLNTLTRAIQRGNLEMSETDGELVIIHTLNRPVKLESGDITSITYLDKVGKAKIAMDAVGGKKSQAKQNQFMATMGDVPPNVLMNLKGFDSTIFSRLAVVFSMV